MLRRCLPPSELTHAKAAADQRRAFLKTLLAAEMEKGLGEDGSSAKWVLELPSGPKEYFITTVIYDARCAKFELLEWEISSVQRLLMGRVGDCAEYCLLENGIDRMGGQYKGVLGGVYLRSTRALVSNRYFPWMVVVETNHPDIFDTYFRYHRDWIAIEVAFDTISYPIAYELCKKPGSIDGIIGGVLRSRNPKAPQYFKSAALTCAHVVSPDCIHRINTGQHGNQISNKGYFPSLDTEAELPDLALLSDEKDECFDTVNLRQLSLIAASEIDIEDYCHHKRLVYNIHDGSRKRYGEVYGEGKYFTLINGDASVFYRVPHIRVIRYSQIYCFGLLSIPFFSHDFSEPGDSGSWIVAMQSNKWIGMLAGGDPFTHISFVIDGSYLVNFIARRYPEIEPFDIIGLARQ